MKSLLILFAVLGLVGCASVYDYGDGHVAVVRSAEERSPFGTNVGFAKLQKCEKVEASKHPLLYSYANCYDLTEWTPVWSQGQGGQVAAGLMTGVGIGVAGALIPSPVQSQSVTQSVTTAMKGHH